MPKIAWRDFLAGKYPPAVMNPWRLFNFTTGEVIEPCYKDRGAFAVLIEYGVRWYGDDLKLDHAEPRTVAYWKECVERTHVTDLQRAALRLFGDWGVKKKNVCS